MKTSNGVQGGEEGSHCGKILRRQNRSGHQVHKEPILWAVTLSTGRFEFALISQLIAPISPTMFLLSFMLTTQAIVINRLL